MKILVCDDDISTVDVLEKQINYQELGIDVYLKAYNGITAKEIISKEKPEIVLCDIGMPKENGIEVLKYIHDNNIDLEFAFLTCYQDFEYAKQAIQLGASDYINKPFEIEEIKIAIQKLVANYFEKHKKAKSEKDKSYHSLYKQLSDGLIVDKDAINKEIFDKKLDINIDDMFRIVFTYADMTTAIKETWNTDLLYSTSQDIIYNLLASDSEEAQCNSYVGQRYLWNICVLKDQQDEEMIFDKCNEIKTYFNEHMSLDPAVLVMNPFKFYELGEKISLAYSIIRKVRTNAGRVYSQTEAEKYLDSEENIINDNQILWLLKNKDQEAYIKYIHESLSKVGNESSSLEKVHKELVNIFLTVLKDNDIASRSLFENEEVLKMDKKATDSVSSLERYAQLLMDKFELLIEQVVDSNDVIARAKKYIDENYHNNIDREDVAAAAFVTPNYLSKQFRIKMNTNMREYINKLRIQEAQRLLLSTSMTVSEIATYVGYDNISYFSTVFRKFTSKSPIDWREQ